MVLCPTRQSSHWSPAFWLMSKGPELEETEGGAFGTTDVPIPCTRGCARMCANNTSSNHPRNFTAFLAGTPTYRLQLF